jgi:transcriptional regulator with XRE-family HTH domain
MTQPPGSEDEPTALAQFIDSLIPAVFASDSALARACGVYPSTVYRWRQGDVPKAPQLLKLAEAAGMPFETLLKIAGQGR